MPIYVKPSNIKTSKNFYPDFPEYKIWKYPGSTPIVNIPFIIERIVKSISFSFAFIVNKIILRN